jgi:YVTN family beta-propeller protein
MLRTTLVCAALFPIFAPAEAATLFVSNEKDNTVTVIDGESLKVIKTIATGARPRGMILTPDNKKLIVCAGDDNRLDIIDTTTLEVERSLDSGPDPEFSISTAKGTASTSPTRTTGW